MKYPSSTLTLGSTIFMLLGCILTVLFVGYDISSEMEPLPIPLYIEPAGYAFIIWGFIYLGFIALGVFQFRKENRHIVSFQKSRFYIILNSLSNACWFYGVFSNQLWITVVCMLLMLFSLIKLSVLLKLGEEGKSLREKLSVKLPLALYFGWITVATPINLSSFLIQDIGWQTQSMAASEYYSVAILFIAFGIALYLFSRKWVNAVYTLVIAWAFAGIFVANLNASALVGYTAICLALALLISVDMIRRKKRGHYAFL